MAKEEVTFEDQLRETLRETLVVLEKLAPVCGSVQELREMLVLALANSGQLALLIDKLTPLRMK
jgi:hypothetical protein